MEEKSMLFPKRLGMLLHLASAATSATTGTKQQAASLTGPEETLHLRRQEPCRINCLTDNELTQMARDIVATKRARELEILRHHFEGIGCGHLLRDADPIKSTVGGITDNGVD